MTPEQLGLAVHPLEAILGGEPQDNARIVREVLQGKKGAHRDIVLANAAAALYTAGALRSLAEGVQLAAEALDSGKALNKLNELIEYTGVVGSDVS